MSKKNIVKFDDFINPNGNLERFKNKNLDINDVFHCSYVIYFVVEHCNGEILGNYFVLSFDDIKELIKYHFSSYLIYAINYLDNIVCEVI